MSRAKYSWTKLDVASPPIARSSHEISSVGSALYLFGGEHEARTPIDSDLYVLDLALPVRCWKKVEAIGEPPSPRIAHAQAVIGDNIYIFGGREGVEMGEGPLNDLHCYNTVSNTWSGVIQPTNVASTPPSRSFHKMSTIGQKLYIFGGCAAEGRLSDLHVFDTVELTWQALPICDNIAGRGGPCFAPVQVSGEPCVVVASGYSGQENNDVHIFNTTTHQWLELIPSSAAAYRARSVCPYFVAGPYLFVFGGEVNTSDRGHEGAGDFASDLVCINCDSGAVLPTELLAIGTTIDEETAPIARGWTSMTQVADPEVGNWTAVLFGGLAGNDDQPVRLNDAWQLKVTMEDA